MGLKTKPTAQIATVQVMPRLLRAKWAQERTRHDPVNDQDDRAEAMAFGFRESSRERVRKIIELIRAAADITHAHQRDVFAQLYKLCGPEDKDLFDEAAKWLW